MSIKTRIEISPELSSRLDELKANRKAEGDKGVTKIGLIEELCLAGMAQLDKAENGSQVDRPAEGALSSANPTGYVLPKKAELRRFQEALFEKEDRLNMREQHLNKREENITEKFIKFFEEKENHQNQKSNTNSGYRDILQFLSETRLNDQKRILDLRNLILDQRRKIKKSDRELLERLVKIDLNTRKEQWKDEYFPIISIALLIVSLFKGENINPEDFKTKYSEQIKFIVDLMKDQSRKNEPQSKTSTGKK